MAYFRVIVHYYIRYFKRYKSPGVTMLDPYPRVILVPGVGLFTTGKDRRAARIARDFYCHTMRVILRASAIDTYTTISPKLSLLPPEKQLSRRIALVTGAAGARRGVRDSGRNHSGLLCCAQPVEGQGYSTGCG